MRGETRAKMGLALSRLVAAWIAATAYRRYPAQQHKGRREAGPYLLSNMEPHKSGEDQYFPTTGPPQRSFTRAVTVSASWRMLSFRVVTPATGNTLVKALFWVPMIK